MVYYKSALQFILLVFTLFFKMTAYGLEKGNSAWLYGKNEAWVTQIQNYNTRVSTAHRLNYIFPETGVVHVDSVRNKLLIKYDKSVTEFYKKKLKGVKILADLSFWVAGTHFEDWSEKQYREAAVEIAAYINKDPNADGVFLDLEFYRQRFLPFYQELAKNFKEHNKILSVIVRPGQENTAWFGTLASNAFVVLYGYDLHNHNDSSLPISPEEYQQRLEVAVRSIIKVAEKTHTSVMMGVPLVATTYEWEHKKISRKKILNNAYSQIDYFKMALDVCNKTKSPVYFGFSIWAFVDPVKKSIYLPLKISRAEWQLLYHGIS